MSLLTHSIQDGIFCVKSQVGFTLIEVMVVVTIMGLLSATAVPTYDNYVKKSRVTEAINIAAAAQKSMAEYVMLKNAYPKDAQEAGISLVTTELVESMNVDDQGNISMKLKDSIMGSPVSVVMKASFNSSGVTWKCGVAGNTDYAPSTCNDQVEAVYALTAEGRLAAQETVLSELIESKASLLETKNSLAAERVNILAERADLNAKNTELKNAKSEINTEIKSISAEIRALSKALSKANNNPTLKAEIQLQLTDKISELSAANDLSRQNTLDRAEVTEALATNSTALTDNSNAAKSINSAIQENSAAQKTANSEIKAIKNEIKNG
jgi:type IV pilus assembly protein PilA